LQGASRLLGSHFQHAASQMSDQEVQQYYNDHREMFERVNLLRIFVPKQKGLIPDDRSPSKPDAAQEAAMKVEAEKIQKKAAAGGSFAKLEQEAYAFAGDPEDSPDVKVGKVTRAEAPERYQKAIFELPIGKVSELVPAPDGWHIFKVVSKQTIPMSEARGLIEKLWVKDSTEALKDSGKPEFNSAYFNTSSGGEEPKSSTGP
jgi:parvulin-like peptidyl-prolyl isomerase